ncbi:hypothetical protein H9Q72_003387 [Fusarium xylarioides]|uniref:Amidohydrolase-related domain-containing protein n=1 Tax=Fusarium xylarioides TaxID=221167 RepID=A0A9P7IKC1_9HYPO|nr:hypothetical protein H9Q70_009897 [Fusarium xylarioides]KAG5769293.1 hypothetical protein H9Q72_003387 [Fusarium xylarioides]KAG5810161.1 hypothetical protein H9Q71_005642 [Fusarium xylarioides]KAG5824541.1 hypothetical protein H9Q74_005345 [Fusarium xylarioides]
MLAISPCKVDNQGSTTHVTISRHHESSTRPVRAYDTQVLGTRIAAVKLIKSNLDANFCVEHWLCASVDDGQIPRTIAETNDLSCPNFIGVSWTHLIKHMTTFADFLLQTTTITDAEVMNPPSPPLSIAKRATDVSCGADPRIPAGAWDSHLHIMDPVRYPPVENIPYKPAVHNLWENAIFGDSIGATMPSSFRLQRTALGLALFDPNTTSHEHIRRWDSEGVRAVRVNLATYGDETPIDELKSQIKKYVDLINPFDWSLQLYTKMKRIAELEDFLPALGVRVVFDHYGDPSLPKSSDPVNPYDIKDFQSWISLLQTGTTWAKISGAYRLSHLDSDIWEDLDPVTLELFE